MEIQQKELTPTILAEEWTKQKIVNIEDGLNVKNSHDLGELLLTLFRKRVRRLPIIGTKEGTYMLVVPEEERSEHWTLFQKLNSPDVKFTTSIELHGLPSETIPGNKQWMHLDDPNGSFDGYITIGNGSDRLKEQFTVEGRKIIKQVLSPIRGVELSWT